MQAQELCIDITPDAPELKPVGVIAGIVGSHLEPLTRFDASDLRELEPERFFSVPVRLVVGQKVAFSKLREEAPGSLPVGGVARGRESSALSR